MKSFIFNLLIKLAKYLINKHFEKSVQEKADLTFKAMHDDKSNDFKISS